MKRFLLILLLIAAVGFCKYNATGGTITTIMDGGVNYTIHTFTSNGTFNVTGEINATVLVVAGGGGGGYVTLGNGGGGGAGGLIYNTSYNATGNITVVVGLGGASVLGGNNGQNSSFGSLVAVGGGYGGRWTGGDAGVFGGNGGSGGGTGQAGSTVGAANGTTGQGNNGGYYITGLYSGAGGGGAGSKGYNTSSTGGGNGGDGLNYSINGTSICYAGGGGGSTHSSKSLRAGGGCQNLSGGQGAFDKDSKTGSPGINGTGGGGGGGGESRSGGAGGSGIVIVRYATDNGIANTVVLSPQNASYGMNLTTYPMVFSVNCSGSNTAFHLNITIDGVLNITNQAVSNATAFSTTINMTPGFHNMSATCANSTFNTSDVIRFSVFAPPILSGYTPVNGTINLSNVIPFGYSAISPNDATLNCSIYLNETLNQTNASYANATTGQFLIQGFQNGTYNWKIKCYGSLGNFMESNIYTFNTLIIPCNCSNSTPSTGGCPTSYNVPYPSWIWGIFGFFVLIVLLWRNFGGKKTPVIQNSKNV